MSTLFVLLQEVVDLELELNNIVDDEENNNRD